MLTEEEKQTLKQIALDSIKNGLEMKTKNVKIIENLKIKKATFVTLTKEGELRGCIGTLKARQELYRDVTDNAYNAAFRDYRFPPLKKEELKHVKIEISILSDPEKLEYKNASDLLAKLNHSLGIIIKEGLRQATFLPTVWEQLPDKKEFLTHLCIKADLPPDEWKSEKLEIYTYTVEKI